MVYKQDHLMGHTDRVYKNTENKTALILKRK